MKETHVMNPVRHYHAELQNLFVLDSYGINAQQIKKERNCWRLNILRSFLFHANKQIGLIEANCSTIHINSLTAPHPSDQHR